jgi:simple sugar transport system ATP-binding protein
MPVQIVAANHISKAFGGVQALRDVSLTLCAGEVRCLVGENGSGKSTLIKILAGALPPDAGEIVIEGLRFAHLEPIDAIRRGIQVIYQDFSLFPNLTVAENLALNTELERGARLVNWRRVRRTASAALEKVGHVLDLNRLVGALPVADKQLVAIAKALLQNAKMLILDEPTTALTRKEVQTLFRVVQELKHRGMSILFVGHKLQEVLEIGDTITVLRNGQKVAEGEVSQFSYTDLVHHMTGRQFSERRSETATSSGMGILPMQDRAILALSSRGQDARSTHGQDAHATVHAASAVAPHTGDVLLRVTELTRKGAFEHVSFEVCAGEILGITGLLGSGRTELARCLFALETADSGTIQIEGSTARIRTVQDAIRGGIAYVPEDRLTEGVFSEQSMERNIAVSSLSSLAGRAGWLRPAVLRRVAGRWMADLKIQAPSTRTPVASLSGGNQQKVVLGRWLATEAKVLILNGPTVGIDIGAKLDVHEKIRELARQGMAVLLISDDLPELVEMCSRVLLMHRGRLVKELPTVGVNQDTLAAELGRLE